MAMIDKEAIDPMCILCDNESTVDIVKNHSMVTNLRQTKTPIEVTGIDGKPTRVHQEEDLLGYGMVYYHPEVAANILSFHKLTKRFQLVYDNRAMDAFIVTRDDGSTMEFMPSTEGLYNYDFSLSIKRKKEQENQTKKTIMIVTVEDVQRNFTNKEKKMIDMQRIQ